MGNNICCDENHQKPTEIEKLEEQIVQKISIVDRSEPPHENPPAHIHEHHPNEQHHDTHPHVPEPPKIEFPPLWPRVADTLHTHKFFEHELANLKNSHIRKYGEDVYEGELDHEGLKPNGLGRMFKDDGGLYIGHFSNGRAHGRGVFIFQNGSFYEGEFNHNKAETSAGVNGRYQSEQMKYEGGFRNNTFDGAGVETGDNYRYEGSYEHGFRKEGTLRWKAADGEYAYTGHFNHTNNFQGKGVLVEPKGTYEGDFVNGQKHGEGYYKSKNGTKYRGQYANNERNGRGVVFNNDDSIAYEGEIKNGLPHGKGKVKSGNTYIEAVWVEGIDVTLMPQ